MLDQVYQLTNKGQVVISNPNGDDLTFSNGGVDGEFQVFVTDNMNPVPELFNQVGTIEGKYTVKGIAIGKDAPTIKLDGKYTVYGNPEDGNVMIVKQ